MKDENFNVFGVHGKIQVLEGGFSKNQYIWGDCLKRGGGAWTVCRSKRGAWQERGGGVFDGGLILQFKLFCSVLQSVN